MNLTILQTLGSGVRDQMEILMYGDLVENLVEYSDGDFIMNQILQCRKA